MAQKKPKNAPLHPLRVKWWGQKHIGSSYSCELSFHTEFQSPSTYPSGRKVTTWKRERERERLMIRIMATCSKSLTRELVPILNSRDVPRKL